MNPEEKSLGTKVQFKGIRDGLLVTLADGDWPVLRELLIKQVDSQAEFLKGARLALDVGSHILRAAELGSLRDALSERGLSLWAVISLSPTTENTAQTLGLATRINKPRPSERTVSSHEAPTQPVEAGILIRRTIRSGVKYQNPGHVVIIGDINPGAEVIAGGDVVVWGHLRGSVHAGFEGSDLAVVCALDLSPTQLWICGRVVSMPGKRGKPLPEKVFIKNGQIVIEPWSPKGK